MGLVTKISGLLRRGNSTETDEYIALTISFEKSTGTLSFQEQPSQRWLLNSCQVVRSVIDNTMESIVRPTPSSRTGHWFSLSTGAAKDLIAFHVGLKQFV